MEQLVQQMAFVFQQLVPTIGSTTFLSLKYVFNLQTAKQLASPQHRNTATAQHVEHGAAPTNRDQPQGSHTLVQLNEEMKMSSTNRKYIT